MNIIYKTTVLLGFMLLISSCAKDEEKPDTEKPTITINYSGGFPKSCDVMEKGKTYVVKAKVSDNVGLASFAIDIHHNFDHHTHDHQEGECTLGAIQTPVKPFKLLENYQISNSPKEYEISQSISIPNDIDSGDYHCQISVIDATGWQSRTSVDVKIK